MQKFTKIALTDTHSPQPGFIKGGHFTNASKPNHYGSYQLHKTHKLSIASGMEAAFYFFLTNKMP